MKQILLDSNYYISWTKYTYLKDYSIRTYTVELKKFEKYLIKCGYQGDLDFDYFYFYEESNEYAPIDQDFIDNYLNYLRTDLNASNHILYDNIVYLRNFFGLLKSLKIIKHNPVAHYKNKYYERKLVDRSLSIDECKQMLKVALKNDPFFRQDYTLLLLLMTTGLRNREIRNLCVDQISFERSIIYVDRGQRNSPNTVYMPSSIKNELQRYLSHPSYKEWAKEGNELVFFKNTKMLSYEKLSRTLKKISKEAGITKNITLHSFRHTTAYLMQTAGIDISIIKRQLRHSAISTTIKYLPPLAQMNTKKLKIFSK
ncbi:tyrosine-type recombinase/integrase [Bacillus sp. N3536]|nr:tyrosine-type recombinase/integrase [Bacillus sp. N3536]